MSDKEAVRLAEHIVRAAFGDLVGHVASVLLQRGRLNLPELCHYAKLRPRSAQAVIIILIQHNLAWHCEAQQGENLVEYFEVNVKECLMRLRWGRILSTTEDEFGQDGRKVVELLLTRGKLRSPEILAAMNVHDEAHKQRLIKIILKLITTSHVLPTSAMLHIAPFDEMYAKRKAAERAITGLPSANELVAIRARVLEEVRAARREEQLPEKAIIEGVKRKANGTGSGSSKKPKTDDVETINPRAYLRVNYERYDVTMRNHLLELAAADRWNKQAGYVMKAALKATMDDQSNLRQHISDTTSVTMLLPHLTETEKDSLSYGFGASSSTSRSRQAELTSAYLALLAGEDNMAADHASGVFLEAEGGGSKGGGQQYRVALERICGRLKRQLLDSVVMEKWGDEGKRLIKIIEISGMINEPKIAETSLLSLSAVRNLLARMHEQNIIELQQIPRGTDRSAQRMIFFWYIDLSRTYGSLLATMYKTLANLAQRRAAEVEKRRALLERANRTDVKENQELLSERDRKELKELTTVLGRITLAEMRTEMNVFVLRDLPGGPQGPRHDEFFV